jgi:predicted PurR-regulated permease PerM
VSRYQKLADRVRTALRTAARRDRDAHELPRPPTGTNPGRGNPDGTATVETTEPVTTEPVTAETRRPETAEAQPPRRHEDVHVSRGLRIAAAWSWRFLTVLVAIGVVLWLLAYVRLVVVPIIIALLLSALLEPAAARLRRLGVPRSLAAAIVLIGGLGAVVGILTAVIQAFIDGFPQLSSQVQQGIEQIQSWLRHGPLHLSQQQLDQLLASARDWLDTNRKSFTEGALSTARATASTVGDVLVGMFLVLILTFFFMRDGRVIWNFITRLFPRAAEAPVYGAGDASWRTLTSYVRATVLVAFIDAVGIGLAALLLGLPLWFPIAALVFLSSFIPIVGATVSGAVAVLVALVTHGPVTALIMLAAVILVQQLEGHVLQPLLLGRAVALHPVAVIVAIGTGVVLAGIVGALIAVPTIAVLNTAFRYLNREPGVEPEVRPG